MGSSGGGWITLGACILMGRQNQKLVKTAFLLCPMIDDSMGTAGDKEEWEEFNTPHAYMEWQILASDFKKQKEDGDLMLFPGKISVEECKTLPPTVVMTSEFDFIRRDAKNLIEKLQ